MKIIVYCKGTEIDIENVSCTSMSMQGTSETYVESETYSPDRDDLKSRFPKDDLDVYFNCPSDDISHSSVSYGGSDYHDTWSVCPVYKVLIDRPSLTDVTSEGGRINASEVIDILAVRMRTLWRVHYFDYHVPAKAEFYDLTFQPGNEDHPRKIEKLCARYHSFWFKSHANLAKMLCQQASSILKDPRKTDYQVCVALFSAYFSQITLLCNEKEAKISSYFAMLLVALETLQTNAHVTGLNNNDEIKLDILQAKVRAYQPISHYYSFLKCAMFGHHHNTRARQVASAILKCDAISSVSNVLVNQQQICLGNTAPTAVPRNLLALKWSTSMKNLSQGDYYNAVNHALEIVVPQDTSIISPRVRGRESGN